MKLPFTTMLILPILSCIFFNVAAQVNPGSSPGIQFKKHVLTNDFVSEGVTVADINRDGKTDIIAGAYWWEAPKWVRHEFAQAKPFDYKTGYSNSFLNFSMDVNQDGWADILRIGLPGEELVWYENNKNKPGLWMMHTIAPNLGNESPLFVDIDNDGRPDILGNDPVKKQIIWLKSPTVKADTTWTRYVIDSGNIAGIHKYTHGLGWEDMNKDGRRDVVITKGWWESPADPKQSNWIFHPANLGEDCSQIYAIDTKEKDALVLLSASAHNYGIWLHKKTSADTGWAHTTLFDKFSQTHGVSMTDINGDGRRDFVTGKRFFAHNGKDPGEFEPAVLYWFEREAGDQPVFTPHLVDDSSGVGLQVTTQDMNKDGLIDIVVGNKKGVFYFEQIRR